MTDTQAGTETSTAKKTVSRYYVLDGSSNIECRRAGEDTRLISIPADLAELRLYAIEGLIAMDVRDSKEFPDRRPPTVTIRTPRSAHVYKLGKRGLAVAHALAEATAQAVGDDPADHLPEMSKRVRQMTSEQILALIKRPDVDAIYKRLHGDEPEELPSLLEIVGVDCAPMQMAAE